MDKENFFRLSAETSCAGFPEAVQILLSPETGTGRGRPRQRRKDRETGASGGFPAPVAGRSAPEAEQSAGRCGETGRGPSISCMEGPRLIYARDQPGHSYADVIPTMDRPGARGYFAREPRLPGVSIGGGVWAAWMARGSEPPPAGGSASTRYQVDAAKLLASAMSAHPAQDQGCLAGAGACPPWPARMPGERWPDRAREPHPPAPRGPRTCGRSCGWSGGESLRAGDNSVGYVDDVWIRKISSDCRRKPLVLAFLRR